MRYLLAILTPLFLLTACDQGGGGSSNNTTQSTDPMIGNTYFRSYTHQSGDRYVYAFKVISDNQVGIVMFKKPANSSAIIYRKSSGTYSKSGTTYRVNYTYETCNPVGSEQMDITGNPSDILFIRLTGDPTGYYYHNDKYYYVPGLSSLSVDSATEDVGCNLIAKTKAEIFKMVGGDPSKSTRKPASDKGWVEIK